MVTMAPEAGVNEKVEIPAGDFRQWCEDRYEEMLVRHEAAGHYPPQENRTFNELCATHPGFNSGVTLEVQRDVKERWSNVERRHVPHCYVDNDLYQPFWKPMMEPVFLPGESKYTTGLLDDARQQLEAVLALEVSKDEKIQTVDHFCIMARGTVRTVWYVDACPDGSHPGFAVPPRWEKDLPKSTTVAKRLGMTKQQAETAIQSGNWFRATNLITVFKFNEGPVVVVRGYGNDPQFADDDELRTMADRVLDLPDSLCNRQPQIFNKMSRPAWFGDEGDQRFLDWRAHATEVRVQETRNQDRERWESEDLKAATVQRLEDEFQATGVMPNEDDQPDWWAYKEQGRPWSHYTAERNAWQEWSRRKKDELREQAGSLLRAALPELGVDPDVVLRSPGCDDLNSELRRIRKDAGMSQVEKWNEIYRLMPMFMMTCTFSVNGAEVDAADFSSRYTIDVMRRIDWSGVPVIEELPWDGNESRARYGDFQKDCGIVQQFTLSGGAVLTRRLGHPDMALTRLLRPQGGSKPYQPIKPLPPVKSRKVAKKDYEPVPDNNDQLWAWRQQAAASFGAGYATTGTVPPRPRMSPESGEQDWAVHEGWWDFAHAFPYLVAGIYGGVGRVPPRVCNPMQSAIPLPYRNMGDTALNEPLSAAELQEESRGRRSVMAARRQSEKDAQDAAKLRKQEEEAIHRRREHERKLEEELRLRREAAEQREQRMGLPYGSPLSPAWEIPTLWKATRHAGMACLPDCGFEGLNIPADRYEELTAEERAFRQSWQEHQSQEVPKKVAELERMMRQHSVGSRKSSELLGWRGRSTAAQLLRCLHDLFAIDQRDGFLHGDDVTATLLQQSAQQCDPSHPKAAQVLRDYADIMG